jgi:hypothetical protein
VPSPLGYGLGFPLPMSRRPKHSRRLARSVHVSQSRIVTEPSDALVPNVVREQDVKALIGLLAVIEGHMMAGDVPQHLIDHLLDRFVWVGLLDQMSSLRDLRQAINDLNHRLRYARGEYTDPPVRIPVPD